MAATSHAMLPPRQIHLLRRNSGASGHWISGIDCLSWRFGVETNTIQGWRLVPKNCKDYVGHYMLGKQYREDCDVVAKAALEYAKSLKLAGDGKDVWVLDIDETALSNLPYYARSDVAFGQDSETGTTSLVYKSNKRKELVKTGYRILGNMGDQWSDLLGSNIGNRTFKLPDPMYYIS
ncbi:unnamed protein product [Ilex paraguariensis]|uniref:Acid phosphatase n=1 Tax=Ilex paraguariensis TaxID=185542 RepID=A0ABC8S016_9AQUA